MSLELWQKVVDHRGMILTLHDERLTSLESLEQFLTGTAGLDPRVAAGTETQRQAHVLSVLQRFRYGTLSRAQKGLVIRYLLATSGYSRQHLTRLIARFRDHTPLGQRHAPACGFNRRYTEQDVLSLARLDALHAAAVKLVVACRCIQAARLRLFSVKIMPAESLSGFRCTTSIRDQFRVGPDQRCGALRRAVS